MRMTMMEDRMTVMLLAKMLVVNGKWSAIVYVSDVKAQMSLDLLLSYSESYATFSYDW